MFFVGVIFFVVLVVNNIKVSFFFFGCYISVVVFGIDIFMVLLLFINDDGICKLGVIFLDGSGYVLMSGIFFFGFYMVVMVVLILGVYLEFDFY